MTDSSSRGMPLLSGPPPIFESPSRSDLSCRRCNKEFTVIFTRERKCNHCGYLYCHSCSDYQALMPRQGTEAGYDPMAVCAFCIQYLTITAGGKGYLRTQSIAKLKNYIKAYSISLGNDILEKDDIIDAIVAARAANGALPRANEDYYRKHAVPTGQTSRPRGLFSRSTPQRHAPMQNVNDDTPLNQNNTFARPDLDGTQSPPPPPPPPREQQRTPRPPSQQQRQPQPPPPPPRAQQQQQRYAPPPYAPPMNTPNPSTSSTASSAAGSGHSSFHSVRREPQVESARSWTRPREFTSPPPPPPRAAPAPVPTPVPSSPPTLEELLNMTFDGISKLSIGHLKAVLFQNHVNAGLILEKSELVNRVFALMEMERSERARAQRFHEQEERELRELRERREEAERARREAYRTTVEDASDEDLFNSRQRNAGASPMPDDEAILRPASPSLREERKQTPEPSTVPAEPPTRKPPPPAQATERNGLCVICQDEEANIVTIDCGHLAMCRACSGLIMESSRECPLCRTRIVTEARLLRVFKS